MFSLSFARGPAIAAPMPDLAAIVASAVELPFSFSFTFCLPRPMAAFPDEAHEAYCIIIEVLLLVFMFNAFFDSSCVFFF